MAILLQISYIDKINTMPISSMVSIHAEGNKLITQPFQDKSEALKKLKSLFDKTPEEFKDISEKNYLKSLQKK